MEEKKQKTPNLLRRDWKYNDQYHAAYSTGHLLFKGISQSWKYKGKQNDLKDDESGTS